MFGVTEPACEYLAHDCIVRNRLRLQAGLELEHVLGMAQPAIRAPQREVLVVGDQPREQQPVERGSVPRARSRGRLPAWISCSACTKNSISRIPPSPFLRSKPARPRTSSRLIR